ncbi:ABC transporter substrate-binding protein [Pectinatus haikarae]|uniref:NitT/TauT family transport system substrate-binding protein n=1 Tax=Pectinatus haikarae TaxID=349096 RepID=A0ABT9YBC5_9FIRM|nr:ABC transporter substrate-binding protein [Pectinatus haikarae]MDQ0204522.1 NitT/TauT family transport system substrate-binding protein [Pectinatus haikarae]
MKKLILFMLLVLMLLSIAGCGTQDKNTAEGNGPAPENADDKNFVLKVGYSGSLCEAPLHMAIEKGFFAEEGLTVDAVKLAPGTAFESISSGKTDAGFNLLANLVQPLSNGLPVKLTAGLHTGCDKVLVPNNGKIKTIEDLKGKKIGVPSLNSSPIIFAKRVLAAHGIGVTEKNMEVEFVVFSNSELPLALEKGAVDAIAANDPVASIAADQYGLNMLADSAMDAPYKDQYCCTAYVSNKLIAEHPEAAAKYTRAMMKASRWIQANPDETAKLQVEKKYVAGDAEKNAAILKTFKYTPSVQKAYDSFSIVAKELQDIGMLDKNTDINTLQKNSFQFFDDVKDE